MKMTRLKLRLAAVALLVALLIAAVPGATAASYKAKLRSRTRIYAPKSPYKCLGTLSKGTEVTVKATRGKAAMITYRGKRYVVKSAVLKKVLKRKPVPTKNIAVVTLCATRVYKRANTSSGYRSVKAGTEMTLISSAGSVAKVKYKGKVGYTLKEHLRRAVSLEPAPTPKPDALFSGSNEEIIIKFMMQKLGYSRAAACGVAANVWFECGYEPTCGGDYGSSYGIVQWHATRKSDLISWCNAHGYDFHSLKGQLYYLKHDLVDNFPKTHAYMKSLGNTAQDAYDAAYYFCYHFEAPAARSSQSVKRGNYARETIFLQYA